MENILIIEDDLAMAAVFTGFLMSEGFSVFHAASGEEGLELVSKHFPDIVLVDLELPDIHGLELIKKIHYISNSSEIIIVTGHEDSQSAIQAVKLGASDFLRKPVPKERLIVTVNNTLEKKELNKKIQNLVEETGEFNRFGDFIGESQKTKKLFSTIKKVAKSNDNVFVMGETGTGKSLVAKAIHKNSKRRTKPFVPINCNLIDGEDTSISCLLKDASHGTLYLSNIDLLSPSIQNQLLRELENIPDVRIIASARRLSLKKNAGNSLIDRFYYALNFLHVDVPPLRDRENDVTLLSSFFLQKIALEQDKKFTEFSDSVIDLFTNYHWPGNVHEVRNIIHNIVGLNDSKDVIDLYDLPSNFFQAKNPNNSRSSLFMDNEIIPMKELEKMAIKHALLVCNGNANKAAKMLQISLATLYRKKTEIEE